jgi:dolichyl-phosphate beta-glucosyltransferase
MVEALRSDGIPGVAEIVLVDDGSDDGTAEVAGKLFRPIPHRVISYLPNRGKGHAVRVGMLSARGRIRLLSDADLSTPLDEIPRFLAAHRAGYDVVIGSRKRPGARVEVRQPWLRESMGKIFTFLSGTLVASGITDFTCGFKSFTAEAAETVFSRLRLPDWSYDTELLWRVRSLGLKLREVPVRWTDDPATRVNRLRDAIRSFGGILRVLAMRHGLSDFGDG